MGRLCYPTQHPGRVWYFSQKAVTVQARPTERRQSFGRGGYGTCFCSPGTNLLSITCVALKVLEHAKHRQGYKIDKWSISCLGMLEVCKCAPLQCRGTSCQGARNLSRCRNLIACRCACPGATAITNLSWVQEQKPARTTVRSGGQKP